MKIIDIRNTQSSGFVADVLLSPDSILPVSIPVLECDVYELMEYVASDEQHERYADPRTAQEKEMDYLSQGWEETYESLRRDIYP